MKKFLIMFLIFLATANAQNSALKNDTNSSSDKTANEMKTVKDVQKKSEKIMKKLAEGNYKEAFEIIKEISAVPKDEIEMAFVASKKQLSAYGSRYGEPIGFEMVKHKKLSPSLVMYEYIQKREKHPLVWQFIFYKAKKRWKLNEFRWFDKLLQIEQ